MADLATSLHQNICWQVVPEFREVLLGRDGLRLEEWLGHNQARRVKHAAHRTVYEVTLPGLHFYLKHYPLADFRAWMRQLVRPSKARREYDNALEVARRGVPTFQPLAVGERQSLRGPGESFLITRALEDTVPLNTFLETWPRLLPARRTCIAPRLAVALGRLLASMHDAGIWHTDLHAGNLLLRLDQDDRPDLFLIDLHAVSLRGALDWPKSRDNLVMINRWFALRVSRSDRLRFWHAYYQARGLGAAELARRRSPRGTSRMETKNSPATRALCAALAHDLECRTWDSSVAFWRRRDRRCLQNNRAFKRLRAPGVVGHAVTDLSNDLVQSLLTDPDEPFRRTGVRLLKDSPSSTVAEFEIVDHSVPRTVIYKRFRVTAWSDPLLALVRPTGALRSWVAGHGFHERSLPTARPLLVLHRVRTGLPREGYLLAEKIDNALDLHCFLDYLGAMPQVDRRRLLRAAIDRLGQVIRDLHRRRLSHRDLKAANVLVSSGHGPLPTISVWLIDLVGVVRYRHLPRARAVQNLARLHASFLRCPSLTRTDKLRFLRTYMQWGLLGREGWKNWWRAIARATGAKVARNRKSGRPLM